MALLLHYIVGNEMNEIFVPLLNGGNYLGCFRISVSFLKNDLEVDVFAGYECIVEDDVSLI